MRIALHLHPRAVGVSIFVVRFQVIARAFERTGADQDALVDEILRVGRGRGMRGARDRNVILGAWLEAGDRVPE
jgi:hypothetical protein